MQLVRFDGGKEAVDLPTVVPVTRGSGKGRVGPPYSKKATTAAYVDTRQPSALSRTLSRALNITVPTVIAGQVNI